MYEVSEWIYNKQNFLQTVTLNRFIMHICKLQSQIYAYLHINGILEVTVQINKLQLSFLVILIFIIKFMKICTELDCKRRVVVKMELMLTAFCSLWIQQ